LGRGPRADQDDFRARRRAGSSRFGQNSRENSNARQEQHAEQGFKDIDGARESDDPNDKPHANYEDYRSNRDGLKHGDCVVDVRVPPPPMQQAKPSDGAEPDGDQDWCSRKQEHPIGKKKVESKQPRQDQRAENQQRLKRRNEPGTELQNQALPFRLVAFAHDRKFWREKVSSASNDRL